MPPNASSPILSDASAIPWARAERVAAALLVVLFLVVAWASREPPHVAGGDDLIYHALSRSIGEGSYRSIYSASEPLHVKYPPAYPALVWAVRAVGGEDFDVINAANLLLAAAGLVMTYVIARRLVGRWLGLAVLLLAALSPAMHWLVSWYSEGLYFAVMTATLAAAVRAERSADRGGYVVIAFAMLALLTRLAALPLVGAVGIWLLVRRRRGELIAFAVSAVLVVGGWGAYSAVVARGDVQATYGGDFENGGIAVGEPGVVFRVASRALSNAKEYATGALPTELSVPTLGGTPVDNVAWLLVNAVLLTVGMVVLWQRWRIAALALLGTAALYLAWPWPINRLLFPLVPLLLLLLLLGASRITARLPHAVRASALAALVVLLTVGAIGRTAERFAEYPGCDRRRPFDGNGCHGVPAASIIAASAHIRDHTEPDAVVLSMAGPGVFYLSGRTSEFAPIIESAPPGEVAKVLRERRIRYVLLTTAQPYERTDFPRALHASCRDLRLEARFPGEAMLLSTHPAAPDNDACDALAEFLLAREAAPEEE